MLMPKRVKRRKQFRGTMAGKALRGIRASMDQVKSDRGSQNCNDKIYEA